MGHRLKKIMVLVLNHREKKMKKKFKKMDGTRERERGGREIAMIV